MIRGTFFFRQFRCLRSVLCDFGPAQCQETIKVRDSIGHVVFVDDDLNHIRDVRITCSTCRVVEGFYSAIRTRGTRARTHTRCCMMYRILFAH